MKPSLHKTTAHSADSLQVVELGLQAYAPVWQQMRDYTQNRNATTADQLWLLEHTPVFTLGLNGKHKHVHDAGEIPVVPVDRGGQVTYHGPGQLVAYVLLDIQRLQLGVKELVGHLENSVLQLLEEQGIQGHTRSGAPGVYVDEKKIAALGLRIRKGRCYHGIALNVDMDLSPFSRIDPCGYPDQAVTQLRDLGIDLTIHQVSQRYQSILAELLSYTGSSR